MNTCKRLISDEKDRFKNKKAKTGLSDEQLCPSYFHPNFWDGLLKFWNSDAYKHHVEVGSKYRQKVNTSHSAGTKAFEAHEMGIMEKNNGKKPPLLKVWERTHTIAASRRVREADATKPLVFTSPHAMEIARFDENGSDDVWADDDGSDDAGEDGDVGGDNARNDYASDE
ncbi:hypothetical protein POM88_003124 [Heracleum sosnowskyi]|uniref:Uncharacterized protein n=1 Tax=Heracleum sosnowskyi TaxID=360622 RepID=A0AAD8NB80_9APIA|nr:hypothetical protein POM88_003124 [Heracleum sosnowskyi]